VAGDCKARFASGPWDNLNASACGKTFNRGACNITGSTCLVQLLEDWAPVRGCSLGGCFEGCSFALGCAATVLWMNEASLHTQIYLAFERNHVGAEQLQLRQRIF
jgi:hypothetical protein